MKRVLSFTMLGALSLVAACDGGSNVAKPIAPGPTNVGEETIHNDQVPVPIPEPEMSPFDARKVMLLATRIEQKITHTIFEVRRELKLAPGQGGPWVPGPRDGIGGRGGHGGPGRPGPIKTLGAKKVALGFLISIKAKANRLHSLVDQYPGSLNKSLMYFLELQDEYDDARLSIQLANFTYNVKYEFRELGSFIDELGIYYATTK